jgi:hypothetical protein
MEMNYEKSLRIAFVIVTISLLWSLIMMDKYKKLSEKPPIEILGGGDITKSQIIDSLKHVADSLYDENFHSKVMNGRYELSIEHLKEINPKAAEQLTDFFDHQTE